MVAPRLIVMAAVLSSALVGCERRQDPPPKSGQDLERARVTALEEQNKLLRSQLESSQQEAKREADRQQVAAKAAADAALRELDRTRADDAAKARQEKARVATVARDRYERNLKLEKENFERWLKLLGEANRNYDESVAQASAIWGADKAADIAVVKAIKQQVDDCKAMVDASEERMRKIRQQLEYVDIHQEPAPF